MSATTTPQAKTNVEPTERLADPRGVRVGATFTADVIAAIGDAYRPWSLRFVLAALVRAYHSPGLIAVAALRYAQWVWFGCRIPGLRELLKIHCYFVSWWVRTRLQIEIPYLATIGPGFRIYHMGGIIINGSVIAGKNLTINSGVVIGAKDGGTARLGDNVTLSLGAALIGAVELGDHVVVGARSVVTKSFPDYAVIAGVPARLLRIDSPATADGAESAE